MDFSFRTLLRWIPVFRRLERENARLRTAAAEATQHLAEWKRFYPPGHFYSPLPSQAEMIRAFERGGFGPPFPGVDLNEAGQVARLDRFASYYAGQPYPVEPVPGRRFHLNNGSYSHHDAILLYSMLKEAQPRRVIEVGSGFSSAAMLDADEHALGGRIHFTFIDPDTKRLRPLLRADDLARCTIIERCVQDVPLATFQALEANDVLFIDSSHVSKIGSDVNWIYFNILPVLAPGVLIHIHDVAGNLEYPQDWIEAGRAWNEQYLLRAFLMHNAAYRIEFFSSWLLNTRKPWFIAHMPLCLEGGGGQMWLRKLA